METESKNRRQKNRKDLDEPMIGTFGGVPVMLSKQLSNPKNQHSDSLFETALHDCKHEVSPRNVHEVQIAYNEYGEVSYGALQALAELHRRGGWLIQEIEISRDVNHVGARPESNITVETPKVVKIEIKRGRF